MRYPSSQTQRLDFAVRGAETAPETVAVSVTVSVTATVPETGCSRLPVDHPPCHPANLNKEPEGGVGSCAVGRTRLCEEAEMAVDLFRRNRGLAEHHVDT